MNAEINLRNIQAKDLKGKSKPQLESIVFQMKDIISQQDNQRTQDSMQYQKQMDEVRANLGDLAEAGKTMNMKFNMINHVLSSGIATTADEVIAAADNLVKHCREDYEKVQQKAKDDLAAVALANTATAEA